MRLYPAPLEWLSIRRGSSVVEQRSEEPRVGGSIPSRGTQMNIIRSAFWVVACAVIVCGLYFGGQYAWSRGMYITTRQPMAPIGNLSMEPRASIDAPEVKVGGTVKMTPQGYTPQTITIDRGQAVEFKNVGDGGQWPSSDPHPGHDANPALNANGFVVPEASWYATLNEAGTFHYHDEVYPNIQGTVVVR